ncbi:hypothetical protein [Brevibacterium samyangense]|uniref:methenyltetrahydrofolate cyclohydrolase n=1 Tax=Brevibacterium samyangense TaxID=366888 RepID=A0ABP5EX65_9MICO
MNTAVPAPASTPTVPAESHAAGAPTAEAPALYVGMKHKQALAIGMNSIQRTLPADATQEQVTIGRSIGLLLTRRAVNATVTQIHTGTVDAAKYLRQADVIVASAGAKHLATAADVKPGAVVVDVGVTREADPETGKATVYGDVHPDVTEVAEWVSPNPGGAGPMTVALLLTNVVEAAERSR